MTTYANMVIVSATRQSDTQHTLTDDLMRKELSYTGSGNMYAYITLNNQIVLKTIKPRSVLLMSGVQDAPFLTNEGKHYPFATAPNMRYLLRVFGDFTEYSVGQSLLPSTAREVNTLPETVAANMIISTTPATPAAPSYQTIDADTIRSNFAAPKYSQWSVLFSYRTYNGVSWSAWSADENLGNTSSKDVDVVGSPSKFQSRVRITTGTGNYLGNNLLSGYATGAELSLATPPLAPTPVQPEGHSFYREQPITFSWLHNPTDASAQTKYQVQYRPVGGSWVNTGDVAVGTQNRTYPANTFLNGTTYEWQVRTAGISGVYGGWSPLVTFRPHARPVTTITTPTSSYTTSQLQVVLGVTSDPLFAVTNKVSLYQGGVFLEEQISNSNTLNFAYQLYSDTSYTIEATTTDSAGLVGTTVTRTFTTDFPVPPAVMIANAQPSQGGIQLTLTGYDAAGIVEIAYRWSRDGSTWYTPSPWVAPTEVLVDSTYPFVEQLYYQVLSRSAIGAVNYSNISLVTQEAFTSGYWSAGDGFTQALEMSRGKADPPRMDVSTELDQTIIHLSGNPNPVAVSSGEILTDGKVSFLVPSVYEKDQALAMAKLPAPHLIRMPDNVHMYCALTSAVATHREDDGWYTISFTVVEVDPNA